MSSIETVDLKPIYLTIREDLLADFEKHKNRKLPSERELCKKYNVCRPTVHKALEYFVQNDLIVRLPGKGSFFREELARKSIKVREVWGIIRHDWERWNTDYYFCSVLQGLMSGLGTGFKLTLEQYTESLAYTLLADPEIATVWISPEKPEIEAMRRLADADRLVVSLNRVVDYPGIRVVSADHGQAGAEAARVWAEAGLGRVACLHLEAEAKRFGVVMEGFAGAVAADGLPLAVREAAVPQARWHDDAPRVFDRLIAEGERSFFVVSIALVSPLLDALARAGLTPGRDATLLAAGDDFDFEQWGVGVIRQPGRKLGEKAGQIVRGKETSTRCLLSELELIRRASMPCEARAAIPFPG